MKAYKGFDKDMKCLGFQFEEGKTYEEPNATLCKKGFHACLAPLDVLKYYEPCDCYGNMQNFHEVELDNVSDEKSDDSKVVAKKIKIGASLDFFGLAKAHIEYVKEHIEPAKEENCTGDRSAASNTGDYSAASNTGNRSAASNTGDYSAASNTGDRSAASNTGDCSAASNTGRNGVAVAWGRDSKAKGALGCYIVLAEYGEWNGKECPLLNAKMHKVDGKTIKPDTWYKLKNGKFMEVKE